MWYNNGSIKIQAKRCRIMANRINYQLEMEKVLRRLGDTKPTLLLHACCAPCSSATLERLTEHFRLSILYYNPNIYPPAEYHRREAELERFVEQAGYRCPVIELPYEPDEFYTAVKGLEQEPEKGNLSYGALIGIPVAALAGGAGTAAGITGWQKYKKKKGIK